MSAWLAEATCNQVTTLALLLLLPRLPLLLLCIGRAFRPGTRCGVESCYVVVVAPRPVLAGHHPQRRHIVHNQVGRGSLHNTGLQMLHLARLASKAVHA
jgi:hypothetical protein